MVQSGSSWEMTDDSDGAQTACSLGSTNTQLMAKAGWFCRGSSATTSKRAASSPSDRRSACSFFPWIDSTRKWSGWTAFLAQTGGPGISPAFFAGASDQTPDRQGRVQLTEKQRRYAGLGKDVTVVGVAERIEIWDTETWNAVAAEADEYYAGIEEVLSEGGI